MMNWSREKYVVNFKNGQTISKQATNWYLQKVFPEDDELEPGEVRRYLIGQAENNICSFENIVFETPFFSFDLL